MKSRIFVDGQEGTTGLRIHEHLARRTDIEILKIDPEKRKDTAERKRLLNGAEVAFLCLPDAAAREAVALVDNPATRIIDASTAFRTDPAWAYGLPELGPELRSKIRNSKRIAVPGCHASAFLLGVYPLVRRGIIAPAAQLSCVSLTGYSGGGKKMIADYEAPAADPRLKAPRPYALTLHHKHLPEMQKIAGLAHPPLFVPIVCSVHSGLAAGVFLPAEALTRPISPQEIAGLLAEHYQGERCVKVLPFDSAANLDNGFLEITACNGTNRADIFVFGHNDEAGAERQIGIFTRLDNLGKGASGAAIQNLNIVLGVDEATSLTL